MQGRGRRVGLDDQSPIAMKTGAAGNSNVQRNEQAIKLVEPREECFAGGRMEPNVLDRSAYVRRPRGLLVLYSANNIDHISIMISELVRHYFYCQGR